MPSSAAAERESFGSSPSVTLSLPQRVSSSSSSPPSTSSSAIATTTSTTAAATAIAMPSQREVASGVVNLGNTCYMNAVLQALAHSPELCTAIEVEPHRPRCPVARRNEERQAERRREKERKKKEEAEAKAEEERKKKNKKEEEIKPEEEREKTAKEEEEEEEYSKGKVKKTQAKGVIEEANVGPKSDDPDGKGGGGNDNGDNNNNGARNDAVGDDNGNNNNNGGKKTKKRKDDGKKESTTSTTGRGGGGRGQGQGRARGRGRGNGGGGRKSRSPPPTSSSTTTTTRRGGGRKSPLPSQASHTNGSPSNCKRDEDDDDDENDENDDEFCALCELEAHMGRVHRSALEGSAGEAAAGGTGAASSYSSSAEGGGGGGSGGGGRTSPVASAEGGGAVAPSAFVRGFVSQVAPWFKLGVQEDSHEFLRLLIDAMQKSCERAKEEAETTAVVAASCSGEDKKKKVEKEKGNKAKTRESGGGGESETKKTKESEVAKKNRKGKKKKNERDDDDDESMDVDGDKSGRTSSSAAPNGNKAKKEDEGVEEIEYPFKLFRGTVESNVKCSSCDAVSSKLDPIEDLGLEVHAELSNASFSSSSSLGGGGGGDAPSSSPRVPRLAEVKSSMEKYVRSESLCGYKCSRCGSTGFATKTSRLASVPPILTLHLKRFRYGSASGLPGVGAGGSSSGSGWRDGAGGGPGSGSTSSSRRGRASELASLQDGSSGRFGGTSGSAKIEGHVKFEQFFDLRTFLTPDLQKLHTRMFCRLFAVVVHAGKNSHSGHYVAYVRNVGKNEWWKMDDARVTRSGWNEVQHAEAYMLFYRVMDHPVAKALSMKQEALIEARRREEDEEAEARKRRAEVEERAKRNGVSSAAGGGEKRQDKEERSRANAKAMTGKDAWSAARGSGGAEPGGAGSGSASAAAATVAASGAGTKRKRAAPAYASGQEWSRAMLEGGDDPRVLKMLRAVEEFVGEAVEFKPGYFCLIMDEANESDSRVGGGPREVSAEDVQGDIDILRKALLDLIHKLATDADRGNDGRKIFRPDTSNGVLSLSANGSLVPNPNKTLIVPAVDANEAVL